MFSTIVVPVDGSEAASTALDIACTLASANGARLHILHIPQSLAHETLLVWGVGAVPMEASTEQLERTGRQLLDAATQAARERGITNVEGSLHQGDPARVITAQAKALDADAIVMGSRGLSDIAGLVVGSVSHKVSHTASCRVISVH
ncbi:universal stress protein [Chromohalobacter sarecensis]|uniref:Universal stress protein n=1 Tax=Chromohalobacter sarecensis TaxID=245294 RepID=A0ABV9D606_9GAMM|nr:universal stress protein [Chromohalobacter sarecensis]MCK0714065.1 universal stress protein [Chromohalobacter sarecensis]